MAIGRQFTTVFLKVINKLITVGGALNRTLGWRGRPMLESPLPEGTRWVDIWSVHDPVPMGSLDRDLIATSGVAAEEVRVANTLTPIVAHTTYWQNAPEVIATLRRLKTQIDAGMFPALQRTAAWLLRSTDLDGPPVAVYRARRDLACAALVSTPPSAVPPVSWRVTVTTALPSALSAAADTTTLVWLMIRLPAIPGLAPAKVSVPVVAGLFYGIKPAVTAIVVQAAHRRQPREVAEQDQRDHQPETADDQRADLAGAQTAPERRGAGRGLSRA